MGAVRTVVAFDDAHCVMSLYLKTQVFKLSLWSPRQERGESEFCGFYLPTAVSNGRQKPLFSLKTQGIELSQLPDKLVPILGRLVYQ
jgi:hypothetical protein